MLKFCVSQNFTFQCIIMVLMGKGFLLFTIVEVVKVQIDKGNIGANQIAAGKNKDLRAANRSLVDLRTSVDKRSADSSDDIVSITILHTNDIHGHTEPFIDEKKSPDIKVGGLTYLGDTIKREKAKAPDNTLLLDAGDISTGGAVSDHFKALPVVDAMNNLGYDAMTVGNHDLDVGLDGLKGITERAKFPILSANLEDDSGKLDKIGSYIIKDINGIKVGILGLTTTDAITTSMMDPKEKEKIKFLAVVDTAQRNIKKMREEGADLIVALSHLGIDEDCRLAGKVNGINVIIGGHSHTEMREILKINGAYITQAGKAGENLGKIQFDVRKEMGKTRIKNVYSELIPITSEEARSDKNVRGVLYKFTKLMKFRLEKVVGKAPFSLSQRDYHYYKEESPLGNFVTDAVRKESGTDICMLSPSGFRKNLNSGDVTVGDIHEVYPFNDKLSIAQLKGSQIKAVMEDILSSPFHSFTLSGLKVKMDTSLPKGERILEIRGTDDKPLDPDKTYIVGAQSSLFRFSISKTLFKSKGNTYKGPVRDLLIEHIRKNPDINGKNDGRIVNLSKL